MNYNIPPWMINKKYLIMLSFVILRPNCIIVEAFDVYLQPLVEELNLLWEVGVPIQDASEFKSKPNSTCVP